MKPKAAPKSRAAWLGPWLTVAAVLLNVTLNLVFAESTSLNVWMFQAAAVPALTITGLVVSLIGFRKTRDGQLSGKEHAVTGLWMAGIYLLLIVGSTVLEILRP